MTGTLALVRILSRRTDQGHRADCNPGSQAENGSHGARGTDRAGGSPCVRKASESSCGPGALRRNSIARCSNLRRSTSTGMPRGWAVGSTEGTGTGPPPPTQNGESTRRRGRPGDRDARVWVAPSTEDAKYPGGRRLKKYTFLSDHPEVGSCGEGTRRRRGLCTTTSPYYPASEGRTGRMRGQVETEPEKASLWTRRDGGG